MTVSGNQPATTANQPKVGSSPLSRATLLLFLGLAAAAVANGLGKFWPEPAWMNVALILTGFAASIAALSPPLATVNVLMAAGIAAGIGGILTAISNVTGYPLGPMEFTPAAGPRIAQLVPWWLPLVWASIALTSRGTARFLLHNQDQHPQHGYRVIVTASGLAVISTILFAHFATHSDRYWKQEPTGSLFLSSGHLIHLVIQVALTALLIDKFPGKKPRNIWPALVWICSTFIFAAGWIAG
ncbi:MAG: hypothetical protein RLY20_1019 [Verrucomicrobiota bacterium]|jgi:uncharacterized membrane protein